VENGLRNAERLHEVVPGARIAVLVRRQDEMLRSLYAQYVNMGGTRPPEGFLAEFHPEHLEYDRLLSRYRELFPRVWVVPYERLRADPPGFVELLGAELALEAPSVRVTWPNRSLSPAGQALLRGWNRAFRESQFNRRPLVALPGGRRARN